MSNKNEFTDRERQLMSYAWQCFDGEPKVDYKKLASLAGMTNPQSAANAWARIKKKIQAQAAEEAGTADGSGSGGDSAAGSAANGEVASAKATPGSRKRGKGKAEAGEDESPTKKVKTATKGKGKGEKGECEGEEGVGEVKAEPGEEDGVMV